MKITKWVDMSQEVEVEIGIDDVRAALAESFAEVAKDFSGTAAMLLAFNRIGTFLRAVTSEHINMLEAHQRQTIGNFLAEQAKRFV